MSVEFLPFGMRKPWLTSTYILIIVFSDAVLPYMFSALKFYIFQRRNTVISFSSQPLKKNPMEVQLKFLGKIIVLFLSSSIPFLKYLSLKSSCIKFMLAFLKGASANSDLQDQDVDCATGYFFPTELVASFNRKSSPSPELQHF